MKGLQTIELIFWRGFCLLSIIWPVTSRSFPMSTDKGGSPPLAFDKSIGTRSSPGGGQKTGSEDYAGIVDRSKSGFGDEWERDGFEKLGDVFSVDPNPGDRARSPPGIEDAEEEEELSLSAEEQDMLKKRILDGLGLTAIPTRNLSNIPNEEIQLAYREYAKAIEEEHKRYEEQFEDLEEEDEEEDTRQSNISSFRFFSTMATRSRRGRGRRSTNSGDNLVHYTVALPSPMNTTHLVEATARFWKRGVYSRFSDNTNEQGVDNKSSTVAVSFYRLDDIPRGRSRYVNLDPTLIAVENVSIYGNEWIDLDMTAAVQKWLSGSAFADTGVLIRCPDCEASGVRFVTGGQKRLMMPGSRGGKIPRLDVRTEVMGVRRVKRSRKMRKSMRRRLQPHADCHDATHARGKRSMRCCRRSMQVRFSDLPRFEFILSPTEFDAYYCSGKCPARYNPANEHALLQSLLNLRGKDKVPGPCCAPTKLKGLNILHVGDDGKIRTTFWSDVIVTECGCA